ncbi:MAG: FAD-dependent oxidoreductase [Gracilibacteraceae bacterium]|jgi:glycine/D-amino acid oxidase-like deaminating enzyme|nr:FAD-dependent oxidoreductase [Gracilibacteraceae bacterium]
MSVSRSLWLQNPPQVYYPPLQGDLTTDVCVIGGGITGLTTAVLLREAGVEVTLIEAREVASGTTGHTTAKITSQHDLIYHTLINRFGHEMAAQYADAQQTAIEEIAAMIQRHNIDCAFERQNAYQFTEDPKNNRALAREHQAALRLNLPAQLLDKTRLDNLNLPFRPVHALCYTDQAQFDPVAYTRTLARIFCDLGGQIYEQTRAQDILAGEIVHGTGRIFATHIIVASHFPLRNVPGWYFARQYAHRSYIIAVHGAEPFAGMWLSTHKHGHSFRWHNNLLLVGGADHKTGRQSRKPHYDLLRDTVRNLYPNSLEVARWSAQDGITGDSIPYVGSYSSLLPGVWVATGFAKWGMTNSMAASIILRDSILEQQNPWSDIFSPKRPTTMNAAWVSLGRVATTATNYTIWPMNKRPVCTHLGCRTRYQTEDGTWECPCHGSRFDAAGVPLDGPAVKNLDPASLSLEQLYGLTEERPLL